MRDPFVRVVLELRDGGVLQSRFDRQQANRRRPQLIVEELGRAHRRSAGRRRQQPLAEIREEDRIDQLGFAARKLGDERDDQLVLMEPLDKLRDFKVDLRVGELLLAKPLVKASDAARKASPPVAVGLETGGQVARRDHSWRLIVQKPLLSRGF